MLVQRHIFRDVGQVAARLGRLRGRVDAIHPHLARGRRHEAEEEAERGGLAGAIGAEQRIELAGSDRQVERVQDGLVAIAGGGAACFQHKVGAGGAGLLWIGGQTVLLIGRCRLSCNTIAILMRMLSH